MADNVSVTPGSGAIIATRDSGGGVEVQRVIPNTWNGTTATDVGATNPLPVSPNNQPASAALADATANPTTTLIEALLGKFNGTTWDRVYNNTQGQIFASGAQTTTVSSSAQTNFNARGVTVVVNVTAVSGTTPTLVPTFQAQDSVSTNWYTLNTAPTNVTANGTYIYQVYPGASGGALTQVTSIALPRTWRLTLTIGGTTPSFTLSASYAYIL